MERYSNVIVRHQDADETFLDRVIALKQKAWSYPKESQLAWMESNLKDGDLHVILMRGEIDVAYLNLCAVRCRINGVDTQCMGIGNVCSTQMGGGKTLLTLVNQYLIDTNKVGILFCKDKVKGFYLKCNWKLINPQKVTLAHLPTDINTMVYNHPVIESLRYEERDF